MHSDYQASNSSKVALAATNKFNIFDFIVLLSSKRVGKVERIADKAGHMIYG